MSELIAIKGGLRQPVDEATFKALYEPAGWRIDETAKPVVDEVQKTVAEMKTQTEAKNYTKMKNHKPKQFDDKLFKEGAECQDTVST